jgi:hypothetical protein
MSISRGLATVLSFVSANAESLNVLKARTFLRANHVKGEAFPGLRLHSGLGWH